MKYMIAVPAMETVQTDFFQSCISLRHDQNVQWTVARSSLIYTARNSLADAAIAGGFDRVLWLDTDMVFKPDLLKKLEADMDEGRDYVCALFFRRKRPYDAVLYRELKVIAHDNGLITPVAEVWKDYPRDSVFEIAGSGLGAVMTSVDLLRKVKAEFGQPFTPVIGFGEDLSFCTRVQQLGIPMSCDSRVKVGHVSGLIITEEVADGESNCG